MKLLDRVLSRSGELSFDDNVDTGDLGNTDRYRWIRSYLADRTARPAVVDFGCWTGGSLQQMVPLEPSELAGLDLPGPWLDAARRNLPDADIVEVKDFTPLPESFKNRFDVALFLETIEHIPRGSEERTLQTICDSLKPGGVLVLSTPAAGIAAVLDPAWYLVGHRHYRGDTLRKALRNSGFDRVDIGWSGGWMLAIDIIQLYFKKHVLHRTHVPSERARRLMDTGIKSSRKPQSAGVWAFAYKRS